MNHTTGVIDWVVTKDAGVIPGALVSVGSLLRADAKAISEAQGAFLLVCYVDPVILRDIADAVGEPPSTILRERFLPDAPHIKAGDFGEMFARTVLEGRPGAPTFPGFRWHHKAHKNDTVRGPDMVGFTLTADADHPSLEDTLVLVEVKTRSKVKDADVAKEALEGAVRYFGSRLADALYTLQAWLRERGMDEEARAIARFCRPHPTTYKRCIVPAVVVATHLWDATYLDGLARPATSDQVELVVTTVEDLESWIGEVHDAAVAEADR